MIHVFLSILTVLCIVVLAITVTVLKSDGRPGEKKGSERVIRTGKHRKHRGVRTTLYLAKIAILVALGVVLLLIEFPIFPAVPHLKLNISDVPSLLAAFMYGPVTGVIVSSLKVGLGLLIRGTSTAFVGDLSNLLSGALYAAVAGIVYLIRRRRMTAVIGLCVGSLFFMLVMWFANDLFLLPMFGISDPAVRQTYLWWTLLFNAIKCVATSVVTFLLYKATHKLFNAF